MAVETGGVMRVTKLLLEAQTAPKATEEMAALKHERGKGTLEKITHAPKLTNATAEYKASTTSTSKSAISQRSEVTYLELWQERWGQLPVDKIRRQQIPAVRGGIISDGKVSVLRNAKWTPVRGSQDTGGEQRLALRQARERDHAQAGCQVNTQAHRAAKGASKSSNINTLHRFPQPWNPK